jgi:6-phosphogluconolactonase (cycloisomerase 2 family)
MSLKRYAFCALGVSLLSIGLTVGCGDSNGDDNNSALPKFLFTVGDGDVGAYTVDAKTGAITIVTGSPFTSAFSAPSPCPDLAAADPKGTLLFVPDACHNNVAVFTIDSKTGSLAAATGSPFTAGEGVIVEQPVVDPSAKFLYVPADSGQIVGYKIGTGGALTAITGSPFVAGGNNETAVIHPNGKFLYAADGNNVDSLPGPSISAYSIDATSGALTAVTGSPFGLADTPKFLAIDRTGKYLYATAPDSDTVLAFSIDSSTGALTPLAGSPFAGGGPNPQDIAVSPDGKFVFVANNGDVDTATSGSVSAFSLNASTGALTAVAGSPFTAGPNPKRLAVDPSGKYLYTTNEDSDNMSAFSINAGSGVLTAITGSPFATNIGSEGVTVTHQ